MSTDRSFPATAPGFRFNPTDEELISYYLKRKVQRKPFPLDLIGEVDVYNHADPSALPEQSKMKTKEREWFFFTSVEKHRTRIKRKGTTRGYWRQRGLVKDIRRGGGGDVGEVIGKVKRLVFETGRGPNHRPTNWVIHEYRLVDTNDDGHAFEVLCKLYDTSGNIKAPFSEQEWGDDDGRALVHANRINEKIQQESDDFGIKNLFDLNELPGEFEMDDDLNDACPLPCALNKEAPLPFIQYKRKRQIDFFGSYANSSQTTHQDHCSSTKTTRRESIPSTVLEESEPEEPVNTTMIVPTRYADLIKVLQKERQQIAAERERYKSDMTNAEMVIRDLVGKNNALLMEIEELKKKNSNKEQGP